MLKFISDIFVLRDIKNTLTLLSLREIKNTLTVVFSLRKIRGMMWSYKKQI